MAAKQTSAPFVREMWGPEDEDEEGSVEPGWDDVRRAIDELGEPGRSMVLLAGEEETPHLCIGGGADGRYILYVTRAEGSFSSAIDPGAGDDPVRVMTGGDLREFPAHLCVDKKTVERAAKTFFETGELDETVTWEEE